MLRAELQVLASSRIEDLARPLHAMSESLQGLIVRLGNLVERAATAMEGLSLASACVQASSAKHLVVAASSTPPPLADHNVGFEDCGEFDLFDVPVVQASSSLLELAVEPMAYAAAKFADACLRGLHGDSGIVECSYVDSQVTELPFFASKVPLGRSGVEEILPLGPLNEFERAGLEKAKKELSESIQKGVSFVNK
ncbi:hypothetical protein ACQ4PT_004431 [Festuca glaucescens]